MRLKALLAGCLALLTSLAGSGVASAAFPAPAGYSAPNQPPVLAVYYAWYDSNTWSSGKTSDLPATLYASADRSAIARQVSQAQGAGIDGFELNWWGPGNPTDTNLQTLLDVARPSGFKVTAYVDLNGPSFTSPGSVASALSYLQHYFSDPAYFRFNGKPFVAFYHSVKFDTGTWSGIFSQVDPGHQVFWMGEGADMSYASVFDGMHPFSIAWSPDPAAELAKLNSRVGAYPGKVFMPTVMPGYDDTRLGRGADGFAVDRQAGGYYTRSWQGAIAVHPSIVSITSWNEWMEGSQIEPGRGYGNLYLQLTRQQVNALRGGSAAAPSASAGSAFYTQAGQGKGGYGISNDGGVGFYSSFQALGGVDALGFPASQRFTQGGFTYEAMQGAVLQWRPELGHAVLANTFEWFTDAGKDDQLLASKSIPMPIRDDGSSGDFAKAKIARLGWLTDDAIKGAYLSAGSPEAAMERFGLPMSKPERHGPFVVQRFQRIAFQHWIDSVAGMPTPGSVVRVLGGDLAKDMGLVPASAQLPTLS